MSVAGLSERLRPLYNGLQPLQSLVAPAVLDQAAGGASRLRGGDQEHCYRFHLHQGAALSLRRKRGARTQAIGPSRGGQTTKIHALADVVGRPFALTLTPGNVSDITVAPGL